VLTGDRPPGALHVAHKAANLAKLLVLQGDVGFGGLPRPNAARPIARETIATVRDSMHLR
jgi:hypothetical protein